MYLVLRLRVREPFNKSVKGNIERLMVGKAGLAPQRGCPAGDPTLPPLFGSQFSAFGEGLSRRLFYAPQRHIRIARCLPTLFILRHLLNYMAVELRYFNINRAILCFHSHRAALQCATIDLVTAN